MEKATLILTADQVRSAIDLEKDEMSDDDATSYSQMASDFIMKKTSHDWGTTSSIARLVAEYFISDAYNRTSSYSTTIDLLLADLYDIVLKEDTSDGEA